MPAAAFEGLLTLHKDGTMSAWVQNATILRHEVPVTASGEGKGLEQLPVKVRPFTECSGKFIGTQDAQATRVLTEEDFDSFTMDGTNSPYGANGSFKTQGCGSTVGTRYQ